MSQVKLDDGPVANEISTTQIRTEENSGHVDSASIDRVLLVTQASGGGVGRHFLDLAEGLRGRGVEVIGVYGQRKLDQMFRCRIEGSKFEKMYSATMRRGLHPLDWFDVRKIADLVAPYGPFDIVHGHSSKGGAVARLLAKRFGAPSVYTPNSFVTMDESIAFWKRRIFGQIEKYLSKQTDRIIAVSHDEFKHAVQLGISENKLTVVPNGISPPNFPDRDAARKLIGVANGETIVGFVGRLAFQKGPEVMLDAFAKAFGQRTDVRLVMVGDGPDRKAVENHLASLSLVQPPLMLGEVEAREIFLAFDVFCLTSRYEGMPYVLIEAAAAGLPIVATRVQSVSMTVRDGINGQVVDVDDVKGIARQLAALVDDPEMRQRYGEASREIAKQFTLDAMVDATLNIYIDIVSKREF